MSYEFVMPLMEMDQETATLLQWLVPVGSVVAQGDPLMEIETDKVTVDIESPVDGVLESILAEEGAVVPVGTVVATIRTDVDAPLATPTAPDQAPQPLAQTLAPALSPTPTDDGYVVLPLSAVQRRVGERLHASWTQAVHIGVRGQVDVTALRRALATDDSGNTRSLLAPILRACALTLMDFPRINAHLVDGELRSWPTVHLGVAVAVPDGLVVPVVRDAQDRSVDELSAGVRDLAERARSGDLSTGEVRGSTFTVSNLGMYAVDDFTAVVNPPEVAILAVGRASRQPAVQPDGTLHVAEMLSLTLCVDHRVVNGADAGAFLTALGGRLTAPTTLLG